MKANFKITILIHILYPFLLFGQTFKRCPCRNAEYELMPDTSILSKDLHKLEINTSYISWNDMIALGDDTYPENDSNDDDPINFSLYCFGCFNSRVYNKRTKQLFTGEIYFTHDDERKYKNVPLLKIQVKNGLKHGIEVYYNVDIELKCYYPRLIAYMKYGQPYKKLYEFELVDKKLQIAKEESYEYGLLSGIARSYDNYSRMGHQLIYEANIIKFPSRECCDMDGGEGIGLSATYTDRENYQFNGYRTQYFKGSGNIDWIEFWKDGLIQYRKEYYEQSNIDCKLNQQFPYEYTNYIYKHKDEIIEESVSFFSDCNTSKRELSSSRNGLPFGIYEKYSKPGQLLEKGSYNIIGEKDSTWVFYNDLGILMEKTNYVSGIKNGLQELYNERGILFRRLLFKDDKIIDVLK